MTVIETEFMRSVPCNINKLVDELKIANDLKALELKLKFPEHVNMIECIREGK